MSTATAAPPVVAPVLSPAVLGRGLGSIRAGYRKDTLLVIVLDADSRLVGVRPFFDLDRRERWLGMLDLVPAGSRLVLVSIRSGHARTARLSDERKWERWCDLADHRGVTLVDWWVLTDPDWAYAVSQFSSRGARWT